MNPADEALARSRTYGWIAEVLLDGWTERAIAVAETLPWMPELPDPEALAVRHQRVLGRCVPPYQSVFISEDGLMGGATADAVREAYARVGFRTQRTDVEPDHAGLQCAALSFLQLAVADGLNDGVPVARIRRLKQAFIADHLGSWASLLATAVSRQGVAELTALTGILPEMLGEPTVMAHEAEALLADPKTGLKDVARYLLVPARCGMWLSADDIQRIAESAGLATGFGPRVKMMETLWFSAVDRETVPDLVKLFQAEVKAWGLSDPRLLATRQVLRTLARATS